MQYPPVKFVPGTNFTGGSSNTALRMNRMHFLNLRRFVIAYSATGFTANLLSEISTLHESIHHRL